MHHDIQSGTRTLEELIDHLTDDDEHTRYAAARKMHRLGRPALVRALELAADARPLMRVMACDILGQVGDYGSEDIGPILYQEGVPVLLYLLENDPEEDVRDAAPCALGFQRVLSTLPALIRASSDNSSNVRHGIAFALSGFTEEAWETDEGAKYRDAVRQTLLKLVDDADDHVRNWATFAVHLANHDTPETRARLWLALDDPYPDVRDEAAVGLGKFGDRRLIPRLDKLLRKDKQISLCYFEAAEEFGDPVLLPAVLAGAERWRAAMKMGEGIPSPITSAIETLEKAKISQNSADSGETAC